MSSTKTQSNVQPPSLSRVNSQAATPRTNPLNGIRRVGHDSDDSDDEINQIKSRFPVPNKTPLKKLEDDPYYKQLMSCSCAKTPDSKGFPKNLPKKPSSSGSSLRPSTNSSDSTSSLETGRARSVTIDKDKDVLFKMNIKDKYIDPGVIITIPEGKLYAGNYRNRCLILALATILKESSEDFYTRVMTVFDKNKDKIQLTSKLDQEQIDEISQTIKGKIYDGTNYIDVSIFFKIFQVCGLNNTGVIITNTMSNSSYFEITNRSQGGFYIKPIIGDGNGGYILGDINATTPVIYNQNNQSHFVVGKTDSRIPDDMLSVIKQKYADYSHFTYTSPMQIPDKNGNCAPVLNPKVIQELIEKNKQDDAAGDSQCQYKLGNIIEYGGIEYVVIDRKGSSDGNSCEYYIVCNTQGTPEIVKLTNVSKINNKNKTITISEILNLIKINSKYQNAVQKVDGNGRNFIIFGNATEEENFYKTLKQIGGSRTRKHRTSKKHRKTMKLKKNQKSKNRKNRKTRRR
jgi:hypothetical protein